MATPIPPLAWTCPTCSASVTGSTCPTCAGMGAPLPPASRPPRSRPAPTGGLTRNKKVAIGVLVGFIAFCMTFLLARGCGSPSRKPPTSPPVAAPVPVILPPPTPVPASVKPSPMPPKPVVRLARVPATPATKSVARTPAAPATVSSRELVRELKRINSRLGEIRRTLEQERRAASASAAPPVVQPQPRRERLSDRELERRYKERLLSQEP